ncbi:MAG: hypothetical protein ACRYGF_18495 [Janthinobacterium lividum]
MDSPEYDEIGNRVRVRALQQRGVSVWSAERVYISPEVPLEAIEPGAVLMNAVIRGKRTVIGREARIGEQGSAAVTDVQIGRDVELGAGSYRHCVLFHGVKVRGFAELRAGTVLEEGAELGHTVGLKNTFFGAWAVAGSCINFCDAYVSGGTSRQDHTEIGSGAMHFNFSPKRDKFGSLLGGSQGLLGKEAPIFVGGNTGIVAPVSIPFGSLIPAGTTVRSWADHPGTISTTEQYRRKLSATAAVLGALRATIIWYEKVRMPVTHAGSIDHLEAVLVREAILQLQAHFDWRSVQLRRYVERVAYRFDTIEQCLGRNLCDSVAEQGETPPVPMQFEREYQTLRARETHVEAISLLSSESVNSGKAWLEGIEDQIVRMIRQIL